MATGGLNHDGSAEVMSSAQSLPDPDLEVIDAGLPDPVRHGEHVLRPAPGWAEESSLRPPQQVKHEDRCDDTPTNVPTPGLYADVWELIDNSWQVTHQFKSCLELDVQQHPGHACSKRVHLPETSLRALQHLHTSLAMPGAVSLDPPARDGAAFGDLAGLVLSSVSGSLSPSNLSEARSQLQWRAQAYTGSRTPPTEAPSPKAPPREDDNFADEEDSIVSLVSETLMQPEDWREAIDITVCALPEGSAVEVPVLSLARLAKPADFNCPKQAHVRYLALVVCSAKQLATQLACALATAFMDEDFASAVRALPCDKPGGVLDAFDSYLSTLTIMPTVYAAGSAAKFDRVLSESLVKHFQGKVGRAGSQGSSLDSSEAWANGPLNSPRKNSKGRRPCYFLVEVRELTATDSRLVHRLQRGLELDMATDRPHLPRVNVASLAKARKLMSPSNVKLDVGAAEGGQAASTDLVLSHLLMAGLPQEAQKEVASALLASSPEPPFVADEDCQIEDFDAVNEVPRPQDMSQRSSHSSLKSLGGKACLQLMRPDAGEEACHVLAVTCKNLPAERGIIGCYLRLARPAVFGFSKETPARFVWVFVGPETAQKELSTLVDSLAALAIDEGLMTDLVAVGDVQSFISAFDQRLDHLHVVPHTRLQAALQKPPDEEPQVLKEAREPSKASSALSHTAGQVEKVMNMLRWMMKRARKYSLPLVFGVFMALIWGNADMESYHEAMDSPIFGIELDLGSKTHKISLHFLVNDIFMCFFFGLAIKEVTEALLPGGSLNPVRRAVNPLVATLGGVGGPALFYIALVSVLWAMGSFEGDMCTVSARRLGGGAPAGSDGPKEPCSFGTILKGAGVTIATDISLAWMFALLIFGAGHPAINFLLLLAIVDDALGMIVIAAAYPDPANPVEPLWLLLVLAAMVIALVLRLFKVPFWSPYVFLAGPVSWFGLLKAHVHPALALCFVVPFMPAACAIASLDEGSPDLGSCSLAPAAAVAAPAVSPADVDVEEGQDVDEGHEGPNPRLQKRMSQLILKLQSAEEAPLHVFEHHLKLPVDFGMFFFGLANAGVPLDNAGAITFSILASLILGKTLGIAGASLFAACLGFGLPSGVTVGDLFTISALGGVGLTVALFVANEAFVDQRLQGQAKFAAVLSVGSGALAWLIRWVTSGCGRHDPDAVESIGIISREQSLDAILPSHGAGQNLMLQSGWVDDVLVDQIMQMMWLQRRYQARSASLPFDESIPRGTPDMLADPSQLAIPGGASWAISSCQWPSESRSRVPSKDARVKSKDPKP